MNEEKTQFDEINNENVNNSEATNLEQPANEQPASENTTESPAAKNNGKKNYVGKVAAGLAGGAVVGAGVSALYGAQSTDVVNGEVVAEQVAANDSNAPAWTDGEVSIATGVNDDMSFSDAFAAARAEVGPGGAFEWHGKVYGTFLRNEWEQMSADEKSEYESHFAWNKHENRYDDQPDNNNIADNGNTDGEVVASDDVVVEEVSSDDVIVEGPVDVIDNPVVDNTDGSEDEIVGTVPEEPEVEVLGVFHDNDYDMNVGIVSIDGTEAVLLDVDSNNTFDVLAADVNGDGQISDDEFFDISDGGITVEQMGGLTDESQFADSGMDVPDVSSEPIDMA